MDIQKWKPKAEPLREFFFDPDPAEMNMFLRKALWLMTTGSSTPGARATSSAVIQFLESAITHANCDFKLYAILMLIRSDPFVWDMIRAKERPEIATAFLRALVYEVDLFATGFRPPTLLEVQERGANPREYTKDDPDKLEYHTAEFLVFRLGCVYRLL